MLDDMVPLPWSSPGRSAFHFHPLIDDVDAARRDVHLAHRAPRTEERALPE